ncbi:MAG: hypothetical protein K0S08_1643 [Gammaproteobacteria bacterium]|jgi:intracellular multiplication protein IcmV|nr:hypothetical protein [Gammaproteobacteria bacterium]
MADKTKEERKPSKIKKSIRFLFNVPAWLGTESIHEGASWIEQLFKKVFFRAPTQGDAEDFNAAVARLNMDDAALEQQQKRFFKTSLVFLLLAILDLFYLAYLWSRSSLLVNLGVLVVFGLLLIQAYFYSFWSFQIKQRKLGCTFKAWLNWILRGRV